MADEVKDDELDAIKADNDLDSAKIADKIKNGGEPGKTDPPKSDPPKSDPPKSDPPKADPPKDVLNLEAVRSGILNEMFGDQFKTVEDVKKANIPGALQEMETLRRRNQELETQVKARPKHHFANDDIAKMNEFVRETGIKDVGVFNRINAVDVANIDPMDALVLQHIIDNPALAGKEPQVRRYFETKYGVEPSKIDPKLVEAGTLTQDELEANKAQHEVNLIGVTTDGAKAKSKLAELKAKIKMPEETPADEGQQKKWTPEVETKQKTAWTAVSNKMLETFAKIPLSIKNKDGAKVPIADFALPEKAKTELLNNALAYVVSNQMEVNEKNVTAIANAMFSDIRDAYFDDMLHTVFERARTMTEKEYLETYHNPSRKNTDQPERKDGIRTEEDSMADAYNLETKV